MMVANALDVAARLGEGWTVLDDVEEYVAACRQLGYQHQDLTMHSTQVRDWYGGEEGLDLRALDSDHAALSAAAVAAGEAARMQTNLVAELAAAWSGQGAAAAHEFGWRSCQAAATLSEVVRTASESVAALRDALWQAVDAKVLATEDVDRVQQPHRAEWLAAAHTVTTGTGDLAAASELIELKVKPFVDVDVGSDWLAAMRAAISSIDAAYDAAIESMAAAPSAVFGVPGELGPRAEREPTVAPVQTSSAAALTAPIPAAPIFTTPAAALWSGPSTAAPASLPEAVPLPPAAAPLAPPPAPSSMPALSDSGAGASTLGSGLSGFGAQLAELISALVGSTDGGLPDDGAVSGQDKPDSKADPEADPKAELKDDADPDEPVSDEEAGAVEQPAEPAEIGAVPVPEVPLVPEPTPTATPAPPPEPLPAPQGPPAVVADGAEPTPCEIAADELPQVGE